MGIAINFLKYLHSLFLWGNRDRRCITMAKTRRFQENWFRLSLLTAGER